MVYVIEFSSPLGNEKHQARYYIGWCNEGCLDRRLAHHRAGRGASITRYASENGIEMEVVLAIPHAGKNIERAMKNQKNAGRLVAQYKRNPDKFIEKWSNK